MERSKDGPRPRLLVVDDEEDVRLLISRILAEKGYDVLEARNGEDALEKLAEHHIDLMVLDLMMPEVDGWEVLRRLRSLPDAPAVVIVTALGDYAALSRGIREGASAYIIKPFRFNELIATCQGVLASQAEKQTPAEERRRASRRTLMAQVSVLTREKSPIALGELVDVSEDGAQVRLGMALEAGTTVSLAFHVPAGGSALTLEGRVRWCQTGTRGFTHGLAFAQMTPEAGMQLRALLDRSRPRA
jgi:DNA-binding response OmpR family regulator